MKARYDYVSNSSSCSFVIKDVAKFLDSLKADLGEISLPWFMEDKISFTVTCLEKDAEELESKLAGNEYKFKEYSDWDHEKKYKTTLEDEHYVYGVQLYRLVENRDVLDKVIRLSIETSETNDSAAECMLGMLFEYCKTIGLRPDDAASETDFQDTFFARLCKAMLKNSHKKENT